MSGGEFAEIEARANAATEGPWVHPYPECRDIRNYDHEIVVDSFNDGIGAGVLEQADAEFIAHAREDIPTLLAAVRESERSLETQKKVADTFRQCLTDTYRPHVEENKMLRDVISHYDAAVRERDNTIARVREVADQYASAGWRQTPFQSVDQAEGMNIAADAVLAALDPQETE